MLPDATHKPFGHQQQSVWIKRSQASELIFEEGQLVSDNVDFTESQVIEGKVLGTDAVPFRAAILAIKQLPFASEHGTSLCR
jgi:hypothetical protein